MTTGLWRAITLFLALILALPAHAQSFPRLTGRVVDQADLLSARAEAGLTQRLAALERAKGHQLVVVTVRSLQGFAIEDYSIRLARSWGIGRKRYNDGVLFLVAPVERKVRIEVGYGLEATLTDPRCAQIVREEILPSFRRGDMATGILKGADALLGYLSRTRMDWRGATIEPLSPVIG